MHPNCRISRSVPGTKDARGRQRGSETIEGALITLNMFGLILLIFDMAFSLYIKSTLQQAARDSGGCNFAGDLTRRAMISPACRRRTITGTRPAGLTALTIQAFPTMAVTQISPG
jgi:hypothetical protein